MKKLLSRLMLCLLFQKKVTSNPTQQIQGVVDDLTIRRHVVEVVSPPRANVDIDEECALATQLDECGLMPTEEVGNFSNEPDLEAKFDRVWA